MFEMYPDVMSVADIRKALGIGRTKAYELINTGQLKSIKIGNAIRVPKLMLLDALKEVVKSGFDSIMERLDKSTGRQPDATKARS